MPSGEEGARCPEQCGASRMGTLLMTFRKRRRASEQEVQRRDNLPMSPACNALIFGKDSSSRHERAVSRLPGVDWLHDSPKTEEAWTDIWTAVNSSPDIGS